MDRQGDNYESYYYSDEFRTELYLDGFDDWLPEDKRCPYCGRELDYGICHECGYRVDQGI